MFTNNRKQTNIKSSNISESTIYSEKSFKNTNFVFGTDNEPFIIKINKVKKNVQLESVPWNLRLKNH